MVGSAGKNVCYAEIALIGCRPFTKEEKEEQRNVLRKSVHNELFDLRIDYSEDHVL
ncbi:MAG: hypothetical protein QXW58_03045 [Thermosphaera sp.]